jgi:hypothetical protein
MLNVKFADASYFDFKQLIETLYKITLLCQLEHMKLNATGKLRFDSKICTYSSFIIYLFLKFLYRGQYKMKCFSSSTLFWQFLPNLSGTGNGGSTGTYEIE